MAWHDRCSSRQNTGEILAHLAKSPQCLSTRPSSFPDRHSTRPCAVCRRLCGGCEGVIYDLADWGREFLPDRLPIRQGKTQSDHSQRRRRSATHCRPEVRIAANSRIRARRCVDYVNAGANSTSSGASPDGRMVIVPTSIGGHGESGSNPRLTTGAAHIENGTSRAERLSGKKTRKMAEDRGQIRRIRGPGDLGSVRSGPGCRIRSGSDRRSVFCILPILPVLSRKDSERRSG